MDWRRCGRRPVLGGEHQVFLAHAAGRGWSRRRRGCHWSREVLVRRRHLQRRSCACDAPATPTRRTAAATSESTPTVRPLHWHCSRRCREVSRADPRAAAEAGAGESSPRAAFGPGRDRAAAPAAVITWISTPPRSRPRCRAIPVDPLAHGRQRVLRQVHQNRSWLRHGVLAQARRARGYTQGDVQPQPRLGTLGSATDHADRRWRTRAPPPASAQRSLRSGISPTRTTGSMLLALIGIVTPSPSSASRGVCCFG